MTDVEKQDLQEEFGFSVPQPPSTQKSFYSHKSYKRTPIIANLSAAEDTLGFSTDDGKKSSVKKVSYKDDSPKKKKKSKPVRKKSPPRLAKHYSSRRPAYSQVALKMMEGIL